MILFPNAKINLGLYVTERRVDGFHNLESCFYPVPWQDVLEIIPSNRFQFSSSGITIPGKQEQNLIVKAWHKLNEIQPLDPVQIHLHKNIPMGAGLGGGSSDAAFFLRGLNEMQQLGLSNKELENIALHLGSDCPFFIENKATIATGKGELFEQINLDLNGLYIEVIHPGKPIPTGEAYQSIIPKPVLFNLKECLKKGINEWKNCLSNDFEAFAFQKYPEIEDLKIQLYRNGAIYASMSGSGSAVFGLFREKPANMKLEKSYLRFSSILT